VSQRVEKETRLVDDGSDGTAPYLQPPPYPQPLLFLFNPKPVITVIANFGLMGLSTFAANFEAFDLGSISDGRVLAFWGGDAYFLAGLLLTI
jgi:hypothetical protein